MSYQISDIFVYNRDALIDLREFTQAKTHLAQTRVRLPLAFEDIFDTLTGRWFRPVHADQFMQPCRRHPQAYCVADLLEPPPRYQQERRALPLVGELEMLQAELYRCRTRSSNGNDVERELLDADAEHLSQWIEHLEHLVYMEAATTIPSRYQQECMAITIFKRVFKRNKNREA
ncbi:hypothetical protein ACSS6W_005071 [Trichoderma asperelloides]